MAEVSKIPQTTKQEVQNSEYFTNVGSSSTAGQGDSHDPANRDESHKTSQSSYSIIQDNDMAEIEKINNLRYMCNFFVYLRMTNRKYWAVKINPTKIYMLFR